MLNKEYNGSLCTGNIDPVVHGRFRGGCYEKNGTLNGAYTKELISVVKQVIRVKNGELKVVELLDQEASLLLTHIENNDNNRIMRKNGRTQLNRASIERIDETDCNMIKSFLINIYGTLYGKISPLLNEAMDLWVKLHKKRLKLVETQNKPFKSFISDEEGQFNSIDGNVVYEFLELINNKFNSFEEKMESKIEYTVQSTLNLVSKPLKRGNKIINGTVKSVKYRAKLDKAEKVLDNVMKWNEHGFTIKEYVKSLAKLIGQGDPRTPRSDLKTLEAAGLIKKVRSGVHGVETYEFIENDQYHLYNSDLAKIRFFDDVKEKFFKDDAFKLDDLNEFIFEKYGLFDVRSQNKRLNWLLAGGLVRRHEVNPRLILIQK